MFRGVVLGNHKFSKPVITYMDIDDAFYNPLNPSEIIASAHPVTKPWFKELIKANLKGDVLRKAETNIRWGLGDLNPLPEEGVFLITHGRTIEVRRISDLSVKKTVKVSDVDGIISATYDSMGRLWFLTREGLYVTSDEYASTRKPKLIDRLNNALSMDSQRAEPSRIVVVANHGSHEVRVYSDDGAYRASIPAPFPGGVRLTHDERLIVSSGRVPKHTQLTLVLGAAHIKPSLGWFSYLWDYGTLASNRADSWGFSNYLIQWSLSVFEAPSPLPKFKPYVIRLGGGSESRCVKCSGYSAPTPIICLSRCSVVTRGDGEYVLELLNPRHALMSPQEPSEWIAVSEGVVGKVLGINSPGIYRVRVSKGFISDSWAICVPH